MALFPNHCDHLAMRNDPFEQKRPLTPCTILGAQLPTAQSKSFSPVGVVPTAFCPHHQVEPRAAGQQISLQGSVVMFLTPTHSSNNTTDAVGLGVTSVEPVVVPVYRGLSEAQRGYPATGQAGARGHLAPGLVLAEQGLPFSQPPGQKNQVTTLLHKQLLGPSGLGFMDSKFCLFSVCQTRHFFHVFF